MPDRSVSTHLKRELRWLIVFTNGDSVWSHHCSGSYTDADRYASSLCYQQSTRYTVSREETA